MSIKPTVFVVEDDTSLQELYGYSLDTEFDNRCFSGGEEFFKAIEAIEDDENLPALIILDVMLPGEYDGFAILSRLKEDRRTADIPVIMVSAKGDEFSKVKGLNMGADDYIGKPFGVMELIARIKANLRKRGAGKIPENIIFKDIKIDLLKHKITANNQPLKTTLKEYNLLCLLCDNFEKVQYRDDIFNKIWGAYYVGESRTLDIHIKELRKKLAEAKSEAVIETVRGVGYMIV